MQAHWGETDALEGFSDPGTAKKLASELTAAGVENECFIYPKVGHAFMNEDCSPWESFEARQEQFGFAPYDHDTAEQAWERLGIFFRANLMG